MEKNNKYNGNAYMVIPTIVGLDTSLPPGARLLYGLISALTLKDGICCETNAYLAKQLNVSKTSISTWISMLSKKGYITCEMTYKYGTKGIDTRCIKLVHVLGDGNGRK